MIGWLLYPVVWYWEFKLFLARRKNDRLLKENFRLKSEVTKAVALTDEYHRRLSP